MRHGRWRASMQLDDPLGKAELQQTKANRSRRRFQCRITGNREGFAPCRTECLVRSSLTTRNI